MLNKTHKINKTSKTSLYDNLTHLQNYYLLQNYRIYTTPQIKIKEYKVTPKIAIVVKTIIIGHVFIQRKFYVLGV